MLLAICSILVRSRSTGVVTWPCKAAGNVLATISAARRTSEGYINAPPENVIRVCRRSRVSDSRLLVRSSQFRGYPLPTARPRLQSRTRAQKNRTSCHVPAEPQPFGIREQIAANGLPHEYPDDDDRQWRV